MSRWLPLQVRRGGKGLGWTLSAGLWSQGEGQGLGKGSPPSLSCSCPPPAPGWSEALAEGGARKTGAEEAPRPEGKGQHSQQEQEERLSKQWEDAKRWSKMDRLAKELTADRRLVAEDEEDDPDRPMKPASRARADGSRGPGLQLRRDWRPSSLEDSVEGGLPLQVRSYPEEKKEEEGSANRRPEVGTGWEPAPGRASGVWAQLGGQPHPGVRPLPR